MVTVAPPDNPHLIRFKQLLQRSAWLTQQEIASLGTDTPLPPALRDEALNILGYGLQDDDAWLVTAALLLTMAPKQEMAGYRNGWLAYLERGLASSQRLGDAESRAALQFHAGYLYRLMNNYEQAHTLLTASYQGWVALGVVEGQARALNQLAYLAWQHGRYDEAAQLAEQAAALPEVSPTERATSLSALGLVAVRRNELTLAEANHRQALEIRTQWAQQRQMAWSMQNLADVLRTKGDFATAADYLEEAIALFAKLEDQLSGAIAQMNLGIVRHRQGGIQQALALYTIAEDRFRQFGDPFNLAKVLINQGISYFALHDWEAAERVCSESATLFQSFGNQGEYLNARDGVGISYLEQAHYAEALAIFTEIQTQLPEIAHTYFYQSLSGVLPGQIERARRGLGQG